MATVDDLTRDFKEDDILIVKEIDKEVRAVVNEAAEFAQSNPEPDASQLYTDVLVKT